MNHNDGTKYLINSLDRDLYKGTLQRKDEMIFNLLNRYSKRLSPRLQKLREELKTKHEELPGIAGLSAWLDK